MNGKYAIKTFTCKEDIMEVVDILIKEVEDMNKKTGKSFSSAASLHSQIPHFTCMNHFLNAESQNDINKYLFSSEYNVPAYPGTYGEYPKRWIEKVSIITKAVNDKRKKEQANLNRSNNG